jgi:succinate-acetate transporter protein
MLAWFLYTYIQYFIQLKSGVTPIQVETSLKAVFVALAVVQVCSLALVFTPSSNDWFRPEPAKGRCFFLGNC